MAFMVAAQTMEYYMTLVVTQAMDINTDSGYSKSLDPDMSLSSSLDQDITMITGGSREHSY